MTIQAVRGMKDVRAPEVYKLQKIEATAREVFAAFGFSEWKLPLVERTELFARSIGADTDIVEKEMYTFADRSGDSLTLRPEATAGVVRSYLENKLYGQPGPHKLFVVGPMFRHERPQLGRLRQFTQIDAEVLGDMGPQVDAELMVMLAHLLKRLDLANVALVINSLGCPACRPSFRQAITSFLAERSDALCEDCRRRLAHNPLRVLDCKVETCNQATQGAPLIRDHLCQECVSHFSHVKGLILAAGVDFREDPRLVRGLDYYTRTTFEAIAGDLGAQNAVAGGGRYDGLCAELGGPEQGAIGFACGLERLALILPDQGDAAPRPALFVAALGKEPRAWAFQAAQKLRKQGVYVEMTPEDKSLKAQMRKASKLDAEKVLIVGENELAKGSAPLKNLADGQQREIALDFLGDEFPASGKGAP